MVENEVIVVDGIPDSEYNAIIQQSVEYAIISLPFTIDRMAIPNPIQRALNIAKGKLAELLFRKFCAENSIPADFNSCATPFWTIDKRDFVLNNKEWDIKNNFMYYPKTKYSGNYIDLPALVPNRFTGDQWTKRYQHLFSATDGVSFLFTFLKNADLINGNRGAGFLEIKLSAQQNTFLSELYSKYKGQAQTKEPFSSQWFWENMNKKGHNNYYTLLDKPDLYITGYAENAHYNLFKNTGPLDINNQYENYIKPKWYIKSQKGSCNFLQGTLWTTITNATTPITSLPSFISLFPNLKSEMKIAHSLIP